MEDKGEHHISEDIKTISVKEFREKGYLQELNRRFLHPLGLALSVFVNGEEEKLGEIWDCRDDEEGMLFDISNSDKERIENFQTKKEFVDNELDNKIQKRINILGFSTEPIPEKNEK